MLSSGQFGGNEGELEPSEIHNRLYPNQDEVDAAKKNAQRAEAIRGSGDWDDMGLREQADTYYDKHVGDKGPSAAWDELYHAADTEIEEARVKAWAAGNHEHANYMARMLPTFKNQWGQRIMKPQVPGALPHPRTSRER